MSDQTQPGSNQQTIVIALVVIAVLLAAIVGVIVWQQSKAANVPEPTVSNPAAGAAAGGAAAGGAAAGGAAAGGAAAGAGAMGGATAQAPSAAFDAKTATKVPSGMTPEQVVKTYNEDVIAGKYAEAYKLLPLDKQQSYGSADAYQQQVAAYGINAYNMGAPVESGDEVSIAAEQVTPQMPITYTWTFKKVGDQWFVASRTMGGSVK
jgi:flagellar basal body-associated protein FliL